MTRGEWMTNWNLRVYIDGFITESKNASVDVSVTPRNMKSFTGLYLTYRHWRANIVKKNFVNIIFAIHDSGVSSLSAYTWVFCPSNFQLWGSKATASMSHLADVKVVGATDQRIWLSVGVAGASRPAAVKYCRRR